MTIAALGRAGPPTWNGHLGVAQPDRRQIVSAARQHLSEDLPAAVALTAPELINGPPLHNPHRVGSWFPSDAVTQAAQLIPDCTLRLYPDTNHFGAITSPRFAADARDFIRQATAAAA